MNTTTKKNISHQWNKEKTLPPAPAERGREYELLNQNENEDIILIRMNAIHYP